MENVLDTKDGKRYEVSFSHASFGMMTLQLGNPENGDLHNNLEDIEDDMGKLVNAKPSFLLCIDTDSGSSLVISGKIIEDSVLVISEVK